MYKKFSIFFLFFFLTTFIFPLLINSYVDPYNLFDSRVTNHITVSNERTMKLYHLEKNRTEYDSVLIGSSRSSYIDVSTLSGYRMFNLSVSGISMDEYLPYLKFFQETQGSPRLIVLSLDFHSTNLNYRSNVDPNTTINDARSLLKQSLDYSKLKTLSTSFMLITKSPENIGDYYTRKIVKKRYNQSKPLDINSIEETISYYKKYCLKNYEYRKDFRSILTKIRNTFPSSKILVVVCPIHQSLCNVQKDLAGDSFNQKWLLDIKSICKDLIDFSDNREMTNNPNNFFDAAHFYPFLGRKIVDVIQKYAL